MTAPKKAQQTKATRSGKAGKPECVLANAAGQVMATRYKTASGLYVVDLFDSLGTKLAQLCYDDQKYGLTFAPEAQFQFEYLDGFSVLEFMDGDDPDGICVVNIGCEPAALDLLVGGWHSFKPIDSATGKPTLMRPKT